MKRWRRPLTPIALLLLVGGGAVVNVAVAWVLVGAPDSWSQAGRRARRRPVLPRLRCWRATLP